MWMLAVVDPRFTTTLTAGICVTQKLLWPTNADNFRQNSCSHSQGNKRAPEAVSALSQDAGETKPIIYCGWTAVVRQRKRCNRTWVNPQSNCALWSQGWCHIIHFPIAAFSTFGLFFFMSIYFMIFHSFIFFIKCHCMITVFKWSLADIEHNTLIDINI